VKNDVKIARRMNELGTESAFEVMARAKALEAQGKDIIHLQIGEPDFTTPPHIIEAGVKALRDGQTHYSPAAGIMPLREAIVEEVFARRGIRPAVEEVIVTPGAKPIIFFSILAYVNPGDEVIYPNPGFPIYESVINFVGGKAVPLPLMEDWPSKLPHAISVPSFPGRASARRRRSARPWRPAPRYRPC